MRVEYGLVDRRRKELSEIIIAALAVDPQKISKISFLTADDMHPQYKALYAGLLISGVLDKNAFEHVYELGSDGIKDLMVTHRNITSDEVIEMAKALQSIARRIELSGRLSSISERMYTMKQDEIADQLANMQDLFKAMEAIAEMGSSVNMLPTGATLSTGLAALDEITGGIGKNDYWIVAGRPSQGKTALALNIAMRLLFNKKTVMYNTLEMPPRSLIGRLIAAQCGIPIEKVKKWSLSEEEMTRAGIALSRLAEGTDSFYTIETQKPSEIYAAIDRHRPDLLIIDHVGLMVSDASRTNANITELSSKFRNIAATRCPVIVISQMNRDIERRPDSTPTLADIRDSGSLEQDADVVIFVSRPMMKAITCQNAVDTEIRIMKQRNGPIGMVPMKYIPPFGLFV